MVAFSCELELFPVLYSYISFSHQRAGTVPANIMSIFLELFGYPPGTIACAGVLVDLADSGNQEKVRIDKILAAIILKVLIIAAPAYPHHRTQQGDRKRLLLLPDKVESYFDRLAKKAMAFFNMSRSICRRLTSLRSRAISSFSGVMHPLPGKACSPSLTNWSLQRRNTLGQILRFRAASDILYPCSVINLTASTLNSLLKPLRFRLTFHLQKVGWLYLMLFGVSISAIPPQVAAS